MCTKGYQKKTTVHTCTRVVEKLSIFTLNTMMIKRNLFWGLLLSSHQGRFQTSLLTYTRDVFTFDRTHRSSDGITSDFLYTRFIPSFPSTHFPTHTNLPQKVLRKSIDMYRYPLFTFSLNNVKWPMNLCCIYTSILSYQKKKLNQSLVYNTINIYKNNKTAKKYGILHIQPPIQETP